MEDINIINADIIEISETFVKKRKINRQWLLEKRESLLSEIERINEDLSRIDADLNNFELPKVKESISLLKNDIKPKKEENIPNINI